MFRAALFEIVKKGNQHKCHQQNEPTGTFPEGNAAQRCRGPTWGTCRDTEEPHGYTEQK